MTEPIRPTIEEVETALRALAVRVQRLEQMPVRGTQQPAQVAAPTAAQPAKPGTIPNAHIARGRR